VSPAHKGAEAKQASAIRLVRLAERAYPRRVHALLEGLLSRTACFDPALSTLFEEIEQQLFKLADRAHSNDQQARMFEAIREIKRGKADILPRFLAHVESSLASLDTIPTRRSAVHGRMPSKLELVDSGDLEISLAVQDIGNKAEIRHTLALHLLGHRLGCIVSRPAFDADASPLAPHALAEAMLFAISNFDLVVNDRILVLQVFDRVVMNHIGAFYDACNGYLTDQRVLANLQPRAARVGAPGVAGNDSTSPTEDKPAAEASRGPAQRSAGDSAREAQAPRSTNGQSAASAVDQDAVMFATLRALLSERRRSLGVSSAAPASSYLASRDDLQSVLGTLQKQPRPQMQAGARPIGHLKQDLLQQLRATSPQGQPPVLAEEDSDTIDLVGMLFDYIGQSIGPNSGTHSLISRLQVPVLRTALSDKAFFTTRNHPARMLLNSVAEASSLWMGDGEDEGDRGFADKLTSLVDRVSKDFDGDIGLIENLTGDLSRHMAQLSKRAEMAERRHVDAAKGREKLDLAREHANAAIARLLKRSTKPMPIVRSVLEQAWTDVLALTILRQGEESQTYQRRLAVADQLLQLGEGSDASRVDATLREEVRSGLTHVGLHAEEVDGVVARLFDPVGAEKKTSHTELAFALKSKPRLGGETPAAVETTEAEKTIVPGMTPEEESMLQRIRSLPFGSWFEFVTNQQGSVVRRKLAWFSTITGRCLFVNQRGARADERTMEQLARDIVRGQVRLPVAESESLIDRAWKAIMGTLQHLTGKSGQPQPA